MSILIKGMEMPIDGNETIIRIQPDGTVLDQYGHHLMITAIPVPPHGDLIDRYNLKNKEITIDYDKWDDTFDDGLLFVTDLIDNAPTIIPTEEDI